MPRQPRSVLPDRGIYHVTARGNDRRRIFLTDLENCARLTEKDWAIAG